MEPHGRIGDVPAGSETVVAAPDWRRDRPSRAARGGPRAERIGLRAHQARSAEDAEAVTSEVQRNREALASGVVPRGIVAESYTPSGASSAAPAGIGRLVPRRELGGVFYDGGRKKTRRTKKGKSKRRKVSRRRHTSKKHA